MRLLLDVNLPHDLRHHIVGHEIQTTRFAGHNNIDDGLLFDAMAGRVDVLITADRSIPFQQAIVGRPVAVIVVRARGSRILDLLPLVPALLTALAEVKPGEVQEVSFSG